MAERGGERSVDRGGDRGGFRRGFGVRGRGGPRGRGGRRGGRASEEEKWVPVTKLGRLVQSGKIQKLEQIYLHSLPIKEYQIVDLLVGPTLKDEVMKIMLVQKQTRAGQRTRFKAFVVVGDSNGHVVLFLLRDVHFQNNSSRLNPVNPNGKYTVGTAVQGNVCKEEIENSSDKAFTRTSMKNSLGHGYPAQGTAEASGQNFREEEVEEKGCNSGVSRKRRRKTNYDESSLNDQVVP